MLGTLGPNARVESFVKVDSDVIVGRWAYIKSYTIVRAHVPPFTVCGPKGIEGINVVGMRTHFDEHKIKALKSTYRDLITHGSTKATDVLSIELNLFWKEYCE